MGQSVLLVEGAPRGSETAGHLHSLYTLQFLSLAVWNSCEGLEGLQMSQTLITVVFWSPYEAPARLRGQPQTSLQGPYSHKDILDF